MSPIKGLTDRPPRLPRIGKIHLGVKVSVKKDGTPCAPYPRATDYFVFDPEHPQYEELVDTYGEKPKELRILLPLEDETKFAQQYYRLYSQTRGLICKGDGEEALRMIDTATGGAAGRETKEVSMKPIPCQGRDCPEYGPRACGETMNLQFLLPEVSGFGVWQIDTGSINSIININSALELIRQVYGRVAMVPLILALEPKEVVNPDDGKKKTVRVLNLRSQDKMIEAYRKAQMPPHLLIQGMTETGDITGDEELPPAGDDPMHSDLPEASVAGPGTDTDLWPEDRYHVATGEGGVVTEQALPEGKITVLPTPQSKFPADPSAGDIAVVKTTGERWQFNNEDGWRNIGTTVAHPKTASEPVAEPATEEPATIPEETPPQNPPPATISEFFAWLQKRGKSYVPTWFYNQFNTYTPEAMQNPKVVSQAVREVKEIMGW